MIWMQQNRKELETAFLQDTPAWNVIASYLGDGGIMNGDGKPPTAASARSAWARVKAEAKAKASSALAGTAAPVPAASPTFSVLPAEQEAPQPSHERFTTATLRNHNPATPPPDPPPPLPTVPRQDSKAVIAALLGRGTRPSGFRKPEPQDE